MKRAAFPLAILAALATGFVGSQFVSTAQAQGQPGPAAICESLVANKKSMEAWMNEQITAGRRNFLARDAVMCAW